MAPAAAAGDPFHLVVAIVAVADQVAGEILQEAPGVIAVAGM